MRITCIFECTVSITSSTLILWQGLISHYAWHDVFLVHFFEWLTSSDLVEQHTNSYVCFNSKRQLTTTSLLFCWERGLCTTCTIRTRSCWFFGGKASYNFFEQPTGSLPFLRSTGWWMPASFKNIWVNSALKTDRRGSKWLDFNQNLWT